jgi:hypothetical protein
MTLPVREWPRGLRSGSTVTRLLRMWVRIPLGVWMFVSCECYVLLGIGLCDELITRPEESYRLTCVVLCDLETSRIRKPWPSAGCRAKRKIKKKKENILCSAEQQMFLVETTLFHINSYFTICQIRRTVFSPDISLRNTTAN